MPRAMARVRRRAPPRPLDPSRRPLALAHPRRNPRDGHREQAPPPQLRRRLARPRRSLRRSRMLQRSEPGRRRRLQPARAHLRMRQFLAVRRRRPTRSAAPSTRTPPPGQVTFHDMDFRDFLAAAPWTPARIGAYFYDGGHSFHDQYDGLALAIPTPRRRRRGHHRRHQQTRRPLRQPPGRARPCKASI